MNGIKQKLAGIYHSVAVKTGEMVVRLRHEEEGQGLVEYGLIIALVAIVVVAALMLLGKQIVSVFTSITGNL